ncbi:MAG: HEAT repeat domain-containing protein [Terriglobales bacterium]
MTTPSRGATAFLVVFGLIFAGAGLAAAFLAANPANVQGNPMVAVLVCGILVLVGGGLVYAALYGNRKLKEQAAAQQAAPDSPWLWQKDWAASRAESKDRNNAVGLWLMAGFWNAISLTLTVLSARKPWQDSGHTVLLALGFCLPGVVLAGVAARATIRRKRFGNTYFEFASLPFAPGKALKGTIHLRFNTTTRHGIDLTLSCVRQVITGAGKNRSVNRVVLWQSEANVPQQALTPGPMGDAAIPVNFVVPSDAYETNHDLPNDQVLWLLHAQADVPGVDYLDDFEVPVFRLTPRGATTPAATSFGDSQPEAAPAFQSDASDVAAPDNLKVVVSSGPAGGTEFYFPPFRNPSRVLVLLLITVAFSALALGLQSVKAPWFVTFVFGLISLVLGYGVVQSALGSSRIEVGGGKLRASRALLGVSSTREILFSEIETILAVTSSQQGTNISNASYALRLQTKAGKKITLADAIDGRQEARWAAAQLEKFIGLKLDTHVAVDNRFGAYGPPPQRGPSPASQPMTLPRRGALAMAISAAFVLAWIGFVGYHFHSAIHGVPKRPAAMKSQTAAKSRPQRVTYKPLTAVDTQRLQLLPEQTQAEELLERALQHDDKARDLFEQNITVWLGDIKLTDRMKQLEWRSRFSTDLRVRYANADLNLAMNGWAKTEHSADLLITEAQTDNRSRATSVYQMGMLAGRGIGYNLIYPVLIDYAKNDPDPYVRQWAVEGMRYLGTDEALDQLFYSFTHDPSDTVRQRAGCNISDCGNFMRKQRMRMAPKLIALAEDPQTSAQMRNWTFLALVEITDEHLPADAEAWEHWYTEHGADKTAEFEQMDWWRVRGDE